MEKKDVKCPRAYAFTVMNDVFRRKLKYTCICSYELLTVVTKTIVDKSNAALFRLRFTESGVRHVGASNKSDSIKYKSNRESL